MPNHSLREALLADPAIRRVVRLWDRLAAAVVGIGAPPGRPGSYVPSDVANAAARRAAGDIATRYCDLAGAPVPWPGTDRLLGVSREQLQAAGTVIGVAAGPAKVRPIVAVARARTIDVLVADAATAGAALELARDPDRPAG